MLENILENYPDEGFLKADGFDDAIIGFDDKQMRLIYSMKKVIEILEKEGMNNEEALDYYYYNIHGAYMGDKTPIWCVDII
jgi:hypothetical protein